jgi:uncharacterized caspase-like protein
MAAKTMQMRALTGSGLGASCSTATLQRPQALRPAFGRAFAPALVAGSRSRTGPLQVVAAKGGKAGAKKAKKASGVKSSAPQPTTAKKQEPIAQVATLEKPKAEVVAAKAEEEQVRNARLGMPTRVADLLRATYGVD